MVTDSSDGAGHNASTCPFCKAKPWVSWRRGGRGRAKRPLKKLHFQNKVPKAKLVRAMPWELCRRSNPAAKLGQEHSPHPHSARGPACDASPTKRLTRTGFATLFACLLFMAQRCPSVQEGPARCSPPVWVPELNVSPAPAAPKDANGFAACVTNLQLQGAGRKNSVCSLKPG